MKRAQSILIDAFLANVREGLISGRDNSSGPVTLEQMADALRAILDGADPKKALKVKGKRGRPPTDDSILMAYVIHQLKKTGDSWSLIEGKIKEQFPQVDLPEDAIDNLKKLHNRNLSWLSQQDMFELLREELNRH